MQRLRGGVAVRSRTADVGTEPAPPSQAREVVGGLALARVVAVERERVVLQLAAGSATAERDPSVHPEVLHGACRRGERVLVERAPDGGLVVVGALRTQPTPGIDRAESYHIEAERIEVRGREIHLATTAATLVLRAIGEIESYAERIVTRAEGVHEIVGRLLRLN